MPYHPTGLQCMVGAPQPYCADVDECLDPRPYRNRASECGEWTSCVNTVGSFECICDAGFENYQLNIGCTDIDE